MITDLGKLQEGIVEGIHVELAIPDHDLDTHN